MATIAALGERDACEVVCYRLNAAVPTRSRKTFFIDCCNTKSTNWCWWVELSLHCLKKSDAEEVADSTVPAKDRGLI